MAVLRDRTAWFQGGKSLCLQPPPLVRKTWRIVLLGPPGVGKGTQAQLLSYALGACPLCTGDLFRAARSYQFAPGSAMAVAQERMQQGHLVPDDLVLGLIRERLRCLRCRGGFILDGFPRTIPQAYSLDGLLTTLHLELDAVIRYELNWSELTARVAGRRTCRSCRAIYHVPLRPPQRTGICDRCGGVLEQQPDDRPEMVQVRLDAYVEATAAVAEHYHSRGLVISIPAAGDSLEILARTLDALAARHLPLAPAAGVAGVGPGGECTDY